MVESGTWLEGYRDACLGDLALATLVYVPVSTSFLFLRPWTKERLRELPATEEAEPSTRLLNVCSRRCRPSETSPSFTPESSPLKMEAIPGSMLLMSSTYGELCFFPRQVASRRRETDCQASRLCFSYRHTDSLLITTFLNSTLSHFRGHLVVPSLSAETPFKVSSSSFLALLLSFVLFSDENYFCSLYRFLANDHIGRTRLRTLF